MTEFVRWIIYATHLPDGRRCTGSEFFDDASEAQRRSAELIRQGYRGVEVKPVAQRERRDHEE